MIHSKVAFATENVSLQDIYGLNLTETDELLQGTITVATQIFHPALVFIVLNDIDKIWCNDKGLNIPSETSKAILTWVENSNSIVQTSKINQFSGLQNIVTESLGAGSLQLIGTPLLGEHDEYLGGLYICMSKKIPFLLAQQTVIEILAKDLVTQLTLRKKNNDLVNLTELYELITETNQDLIFAKDKEFKIVFGNRNFINLYPADMQDKIIGYTTVESYPEKEAKEFLKNDVEAFESGRSEVIEKITFPSGKIRIISTVKTRFELISGEPYILGVSRDITEKQQLIDQLTRSNNDLDEFAYVASHDLKSPLSAIKRLVSFIEEDATEAFDEQSQRHFDLIKSRADRMLKLLSDLLSFSRIGRDVQTFIPLDLRRTVESCCELVDLPEAFNIHVEDAELVLPRIPLELVLTNIISNAVKHHHADKGNIWVSSAILTAHYEIVVRDDGPGIDKSMFDKIFEKFQTLKPRDQVEGSGLGLSMVKKTLEHYCGSVNVSCPNKQGTQFTLRWPKEQQLV